MGILVYLSKIEKNFKSQHEHEYKGKHTMASLERELQVDEINIDNQKVQLVSIRNHMAATLSSQLSNTFDEKTVYTRDSGSLIPENANSFMVDTGRLPPPPDLLESKESSSGPNLETHCSNDTPESDLYWRSMRPQPFLKKTSMESKLSASESYGTKNEFLRQ